MTTNTATATEALRLALDPIAVEFANWLADTVEHKVAEGRTLGLSDDAIVAGTRSALLTFLGADEAAR